jgi:hypothetical protein
VPSDGTDVAEARSLFREAAFTAKFDMAPQRPVRSHVAIGSCRQPASVLANEASTEVENRQSCLTHFGIERHYRIGFRRPSQAGRIQTFVLSQENKWHSRSKAQARLDDINATSKKRFIGVVSAIINCDPPRGAKARTWPRCVATPRIWNFAAGRRRSTAIVTAF